MKQTINHTLNSLFSSKKVRGASFLAALCTVSFEANAVNFSSYGSAPQAILYGTVVTTSGLMQLTDADPSNFTLSSTVSSAHTLLFGLSGTSATTLSLTSPSPAYFTAVTLASQTTLASATTVSSQTLEATVAMAAADQLSGLVISNLSSHQLSALLNAGLNNPASYRCLPAGLSAVAASVLTKANTDYIELIPKYVRTGVMSNTYSTALTGQTGWVA